ncbi:MAG: hypothetical protein WCG80_10970 [Spirochaetales bacterium]
MPLKLPRKVLSAQSRPVGELGHGQRLAEVALDVVSHGSEAAAGYEYFSGSGTRTTNA